jgi:pimeloyl-ACP methyl ester carboxylesterase
MSTAELDRPETAPSPQRPTRRIRHRLRRATARGLVVLVALGVVAATVEAIVARREASALPPPGDLVTLPDGRELHMHVTGEEHDGPVVVLESGQGGFSPYWRWVREHLDDETTVVAYDRPGYGWSDPAPREVSPSDTIDDLRTALEARGLPGPYVLVGHSLGAFYVRDFAARFPDEVAGLVLVDPSHEEQLDRLPAELRRETERGQQLGRLMAIAARFGLLRVWNPMITAVNGLADDEVELLRRRSSDARYATTQAAEAGAFRRLASTVPGDLGAVPSVLLNAPTNADPRFQGMRDLQDELHAELVARSEQAEMVVVDGAEHITIVTDPRYARQVAAASLELVAQVDRP